jgi:hypothetical protein
VFNRPVIIATEDFRIKKVHELNVHLPRSHNSGPACEDSEVVNIDRYIGVKVQIMTITVLTRY